MNSNFQLPLDDFPVDHHRADEVLKFLNAQSFFEVIRKPTFPAGRCYWNVEDCISKHGGKSIYGWMIEWVPELNVEAMHHAIYQTPNGELIDVSATSGPRSGNYTTFIPSNELAINLSEPPRIPRRNYPLVNDPDLIRHLYLSERNFSAHTSFVRDFLNNGYAIFSEGEVKQIKSIDKAFEKNTNLKLKKPTKKGLQLEKNYLLGISDNDNFWPPFGARSK